MDLKSKILKNELMKEIISIRVDSLWNMLKQRKNGFLPGPYEEGATGKLDNKGAIFIPGGMVFQDVDQMPIEYEKYGTITVKAFREQVRRTMQFDNATLIYPDGIAYSVHLDSGFFSKAARQIYTFKKAAFRRKAKIGSPKFFNVTSDEIVRSHCPTYMPPPYGSRTRISSCAAIGLIDPPLYFAYCKTLLNLSTQQAELLAKNLDIAQNPYKANDGKILFSPYIIVCHDTRYFDRNLVGLIRILGVGKFGEFATFSLEPITQSLNNLLKRKKIDFSEDDFFASHDNVDVLGVLRIYAPANPGKRSQKHSLHIVSPVKDLELNLQKIKENARRVYQIN